MTAPTSNTHTSEGKMNSPDRQMFPGKINWISRQREKFSGTEDRYTYTHTHTHTHIHTPKQNEKQTEQNRSSGFSPYQHAILIRGKSVIYVYNSLREKKVWTFLYLAKVLFKNRDNKHFQTWKSSVILWLQSRQNFIK